MYKRGINSRSVRSFLVFMTYDVSKRCKNHQHKSKLLKGLGLNGLYYGTESVWPQRHKLVTCLQCFLQVQQPKTSSCIQWKINTFSQCSGGDHFFYITDIQTTFYKYFILMQAQTLDNTKLKYFILFLSSKIFFFLFTLPFAFSYLCVFSYSSLSKQDMFPFNVTGYINI